MFGSGARHLNPSQQSEPKQERRLHTFEHTHLGVYFVGVFTVGCIFVDSSQGVWEKYHGSKKWFYLFGILCFFAYCYVRPLIRRGIGSASSGYLNYYSIYIVWLCSAVFYHLPKLEDMGMNLKADISVLISSFIVTLLLISFLHCFYRMAVSSDWISPLLINPSAKTGELWTAIMINSSSLAVACSTYFSFCGNAVSEESLSSTSGIKRMVCYNLLQPVEADKYPTFKSWVFYGEQGNSSSHSESTLSDFNLEMKTNSMFLASSEVISPVFMVWITLLAMYLVNCTADHLAVQAIHISDISKLRGRVSTSILSESSPLKSRRNSLDRQSNSAENLELKERIEGYNEELIGAQPEFLPMVPWYCGTSADLIKMSFDLTISLKLFLGRFDMRTMQAATSDVCTNGPHEGDGFTYLNFQQKEELWIDFFADTGDGGNSTYTIARALATPSLRVNNDRFKDLEKNIFLPRAEVLVLGGDLAYPSPSSDSYNHRLFTPFHDAFPAPNDHPGRLILKKSRQNSQPKEAKKPPVCFAIPGNHDWHDGLEIFTQCILHRGWLGGWELPQEKSYFAVALAQDWWLFAADLALVWDIDMYQYRYFVQVIEKYLKPESQVIITTHEPIWMEDWITCSPDSTAPNLKDLIREHLKGRARIHLTGDLHFYMRHSLHPEEAQDSLDPEHLIIQGMGGAFLHPTHVFCGAKVTSKSSDSSCKPEHTCQSVYPSPAQSLSLSRDSLCRFRSMNTRFDLVGALWYFFLVWSVFPRCSCIPLILEASSYLEGRHVFLHCFGETFIDIFSQSYVSFLALLVLFLATFLFALKGSVGCAKLSPLSTNSYSKNHWYNGFESYLLPAAIRGFKARTGGYGMCALFAFVHTLAHLTMAIILLLVLETGIYTCIKHNIVGSTGYHSLYLWFEDFLAQHFPDPMGVRQFFTHYSCGLYPAFLKYFMAIFDVPEVIAVGRIKICEFHGTWEGLTRLQTVGYYVGMLAYYWLLATPAMGLIFGLYLYISCCYFHVHYDETFSALRVQHFKGFSRMKINSNGDLELFSIAVDRVPEHWTEDTCWRGCSGGHTKKGEAHLADFPSRWKPADCAEHSKGDNKMEFKVIDHVIIPKKRVS